MEECKNPQCMKRIRELEEELSRLRSVGFDMLKQRGNWQATGVEPAELGIEFDSMFNHEIERMSEVLVMKSKMGETDTRRILSSTFQDVYKTCKEVMLDRMRDALSRVLVLPKQQESDEELYDICRAYGLLLNACGNAGLQDQRRCSREACDKLATTNSEILEEFKILTEKMSQFSWKLLETVPPLVSETIPDVSFCKEWHAKELNPEWNDKLTQYKLVYYRPILFFSYEGKVSQKGWVGNTEILDSEKEDGSDTPSNDKLKCVEFRHTSYKKPRLKLQGTASSTEQACVSSHSNFFQPMKNESTVLKTTHQHAGVKKKSDALYFGLRNY